jgi:serine/threonine protein kinase
MSRLGDDLAPLPEAIPESVPAASAGPAPVKRLADLYGETIAHYQIGLPLAQGQSGIVFRARDVKTDEPVALKVLWPRLMQKKEEAQRFLRSAKTMALLRHPNVIPVQAAGKTGPYCWIAMDLIEGESLTRVIERIGVAGMLDWRYALRVALDLGRALQFAHKRHVIHRNLTPPNVLVRARDKTALLGDLLLAKALEGTLAQDVTRPGEILGDVRYVPPERLSGGQPVDERSDLYSLGAMVYALLTGRPPFVGITTLDTIAMIRNAEPARPKKFQMAISDLFEGVVMKLLAKRPEERFQSAAELVANLERVGKYQGIHKER